MKGEWLRQPIGDTSVVFVHGILSSGEKCWRNDNGTYWPELLKNEAEVASMGIYVYTYETDFSSGSYSIGDAVDDFKERAFITDQLKHSKKLVFVCHSMGGIVVRKFMVERCLDLMNIEMGLFLVASPSLGSKYANLLEFIAKAAGHSQAKSLKLSKENPWLNDLDKTFKNTLGRNTPKICGKELLEDKPILLKKLIIFGPVVTSISGDRYFPESYKVPGSDHFTIAKPENIGAIQHQKLIEFIKEKGFCTYSQLQVQSNAMPGVSLPKPTITIDDFFDKVRNKLIALFNLNRPEISLLQEKLIKVDCSKQSAIDVLMPKDGTFSPYNSIKTLDKAVLECIRQAPHQKDEIGKHASEVMGWLILLAIDGNALQEQGNNLINFDKDIEIVIPVKTSTGVAVFVARLHENPAKFSLKSRDKALGEGSIDPADLELGLKKSDQLTEIMSLIYVKAIGSQPNRSDDWKTRLKHWLQLEYDVSNKIYYLPIDQVKYSAVRETMIELKTELPHLRIVITGVANNGANSVLIMDETLLETLVIHFLRSLEQIS